MCLCRGGRHKMKRVVNMLLGACLCLAASVVCDATVVAAQESPATVNMPPKILVINREVLKPGKGGATHQMSERASFRAMSAAKDTTYYLGMDAVSGASRSLFFTGYDSFADWEKEALAEQKNAALSAALDRAAVADGELLESYETGMYFLRDDYSLNPGTDLPHARYFEIGVFHVKPGHDEDWSSIMKLVKDAYAKVPGVQWAMYERVYGGPDHYFIYVTPMQSAAHIDENFAHR